MIAFQAIMVNTFTSLPAHPVDIALHLEASILASEANLAARVLLESNSNFAQLVLSHSSPSQQALLSQVSTSPNTKALPPKTTVCLIAAVAASRPVMLNYSSQSSCFWRSMRKISVRMRYLIRLWRNLSVSLG